MSSLSAKGFPTSSGSSPDVLQSHSEACHAEKNSEKKIPRENLPLLDAKPNCSRAGVGAVR